MIQPERGSSQSAWRGGFEPRRGISVLSALGAIIMAAMVMVAASSGPAWAQDRPGQFDFYVLSLSWSPTFCEAEGERAQNETQCRRDRPYAFVVHGLWPQYDRGSPANCQRPAPFVPNATLRSVEDLIPSRGLAIHQWRKHGTCSGLSAERYFETTRAARDRVVIPAEFQHLDDYRMVSPGEVEQAFLSANPGLKPNMIAVSCDRRLLREVRICMNRNLDFRPCGEVDRKSCRLDRMVMPPVRAKALAPASSWLPGWLTR